jgi:TetR/AcrR family transcriptional regulator, tetracycline repressor protein
MSYNDGMQKEESAMQQRHDPGITREKIISVSWDLLRAEGVENFTMRKLAGQLNIKAASLYWHFQSKQHIFQTLANEVAKAILLTAKIEGDWRSQLYHFCMQFREHLHFYPHSAQLMMQTLPSEREYFMLNDAMLQIIEPLPLSDEDKFSAATCVFNYVLAFELDHDLRMQVQAAVHQEGIGGILAMGNHLPDSIFRRMIQYGTVDILGTDRMFRTGLLLQIFGIEHLANMGSFADTFL